MAHKGIVLNQPSVVVMDKLTQQALAVGEEAKQMLGRTPGNVASICPRKDGVIADVESAELILKRFMQQVHGGQNLMAPRLVVGTPVNTAGVEKRSIREAAKQSGAREVLTIDEPLAAGIGANLPIDAPTGSMVVDIGGGTTEAAVLSLYGIVFADSARVAGNELSEAILFYLKNVHKLEVGERTAEEIKIKIGSAYPSKANDEVSMEVRGLHTLSGLPRTVMLRGAEVRESMMEPLSVILEVVKRTLERMPPELSSDIYERGLMLTGGGALLKGIDQLISKDTGLVVHVADDPMNATALGMGRGLEQFAEYSRIFQQNSDAY
ncbi:rod shape-determining protein [Lyngbya confervoides BDU141951]|uniref:Cell shape-determining protein MreB n=2 Tax=Lyngbya TaxID=28073 RepID=A0ABD4T2H8_9CYAN|nr:rod shape-determining protein [Lyngbya confervoides BDU141951]